MKRQAKNTAFFINIFLNSNIISRETGSKKTTNKYSSINNRDIKTKKKHKTFSSFKSRFFLIKKLKRLIKKM